MIQDDIDVMVRDLRKMSFIELLNYFDPKPTLILEIPRKEEGS